MYFPLPHGRVSVLLTEEQAQNPDFIKNSLQWYVGFLPPDRVPSYSCKGCNDKYDHPPKIEVAISGDGDETFTNVIYTCIKCNERLGSEPLESPEGIDQEYISFDGTGDWKTPTEEDIKSKLKIALDSAKKGEALYNDPLKQAIRWAKKISYNIPKEKIGEIKKIYRSSYLKSIEEDLHGLIKTIKNSAYGFTLDVTEGIPTFEGSGLEYVLDILYDALPHINLPEDVELRQDILRILNEHKDLFQESVDVLNEEGKKIENQIKSELNNVKRSEKRISMFLKKAKLTEDQIDEVNDSPLSTQPGYYDDDI